jgi:Tol biopolymer transport system component
VARIPDAPDGRGLDSGRFCAGTHVWISTRNLSGAERADCFSSYGKIYTIQHDGSGLHQIVRDDEEHKYDFYPSWSPDGLRIVTSGQTQEPDGYWTDMVLQVFSHEGTDFSHLPIIGYVGAPAWSPDGAHILFSRDGELFSTTPGGAQPTQIESNAGGPAWSPDGSRIAFIGSVDPHEDTALYTMAAGGGAQELFYLPGRVTSPSWSPDGSTIIFAYQAREPREDPGPGELPYFYAGDNIYAMPATGGDPMQLTAAGADEDPVWSPDGSMIVFQSERPSGGVPDLYLMNADGSNQHRLTTSIHCLQCGPDWASLPPHVDSFAPAVVVAHDAERPPRRKCSRMSLSRKHVFQASRAWVRFRALGSSHRVAARHQGPGNGSCILLRLNRATVRPGGTLRLRLANRSGAAIQYSDPFTLERYESGRWHRLPPVKPFFSPLHGLAPGEISPWQTARIPRHDPPGRYRIRKFIQTQRDRVSVWRKFKVAVGS